MSSPPLEQPEQAELANQKMQVDGPAALEPHAENEAASITEDVEKHEEQGDKTADEAPSSPAVETMAKKTRASTKKAASAKKPATKAKTPAKKKAAANHAAHPSWKEIITECVHDLGEERNGVSRSTVKKFAEDRYGLEQNNSNASHLSRAIVHGEHEGIFVLPKGPSGKIKLAPAKSETTKENTKPASTSKKPTSTGKKTNITATAAKKPVSATKAVKKPTTTVVTKKTQTTAKKTPTAAKKPPVAPKKTSTAAKKTAAAKKAVPARRASAATTRKTEVTPTKRKATTLSGKKAMPKKVTTKSTVKKKAAAKVAASKPKTRTTRTSRKA